VRNATAVELGSVGIADGIADGNGTLGGERSAADCWDVAKLERAVFVNSLGALSAGNGCNGCVGYTGCVPVINGHTTAAQELQHAVLHMIPSITPLRCNVLCNRDVRWADFDTAPTANVLG
jgi:hypothetical protein